MFGNILSIKEVDALGCFQLLLSRRSAGPTVHAVTRQSFILHTKLQLLPNREQSPSPM
jgi:hypothetical protein